MDGYAQPEGALESLGVPPDMAGKIRRRGVLPALLNMRPEDAGSELAGGSERQPRLVRAMNQGDSGQPDPGMSAPESTYSANGQTRLVDHVQEHRIEDDKTRSPYGDTEAMTPPAQASPDRPSGDFIDQAPQMARAQRQTLIDQVRQPQQPATDRWAPLNEQIRGLQGQLTQLQNPPPKPEQSLKSKIFGGLGHFVAGFGNPEYVQGLRQEREFKQNQQREKEATLQEQIDKLYGTMGTEQSADRRAELTEQGIAERERMAREAQQPEHIDTDQGPLQYDRQTRQWTPIMQGGQRVGPKAQPKPDTPEQQYIDADASGDKPTANRLLRDAQTWSAATQKPERSDVAAQRAGVRGDRSYQFQSSRIDKLAAPIEQRAERISRLEDTLAQNNPQADALVAPELLTIMAGGQGSGLRMNEAEIQRIVGGRSQWENLKANIQHWSTDPQAARSITPDQQKQIRALFGSIKQRVAAKSQIIDREREALANTDDPREHRRIFNRLAKGLQDADTGAAGGEQGGGQQGSQQGGGQAKPTPQTHAFSLNAWQKANPKGDVNAAKAAAQAAGYQVAP